MSKTAIELGCSYIRMYIQDSDKYVREPSLAAVCKSNGTICAAGENANLSFLKTPGATEKLLPICEDYTSNLDAVIEIIKKYLPKKGKAKEPLWLYVCAGSSLSESEKRKIGDAFVEELGAQKVYFVQSVYAGALGSGLLLNDQKYRMIAEICSYSTNIAVLKGFTVISERRIKKGSNSFNKAIIEKIRNDYGIKISDSLGEEIKKNLLTLSYERMDRSAKIYGISIKTGLPVSAKVSSRNFAEAITPIADCIIDEVLSSMSSLPKEAQHQIECDGVNFIGGGIMLDGFSEYAFSRTGTDISTVPDSDGCIIYGLERIITENIPLPQLPSSAAAKTEKYRTINTSGRKKSHKELFDYEDSAIETDYSNLKKITDTKEIAGTPNYEKTKVIPKVGGKYDL